MNITSRLRATRDRMRKRIQAGSQAFAKTWIGSRLEPYRVSWGECRRNIAPETRIVEAISAGIADWWLLLMVWPGHLFQRNPGLAGLGKSMPEGEWRMFFFLIGLIQMLGLITGRPLIRISGLLGAFFFWVSLALDIAPLRPHYGWLPLSPGMGGYFIDAAACIWATLQIWRWVFIDAYVRLLFCRALRHIGRRSSDPASFSSPSTSSLAISSPST